MGGKPAKVRFVPPKELGLPDPPDPRKCAEAIWLFCREHGVRIVLLDGPQGWKDPSTDLKECRYCERILNTPGKTGVRGRSKPQNYLPFLTFSISTFAHLVKSGGVLCSDPVITMPKHDLLVLESFPNSAWRKLCISPLPGKRRATQSDIVSHLKKLRGFYRFRTNRLPTHDELQALVAALAGPSILAGNLGAYIAEGSRPKNIDGMIVEGFIVNPRVAKEVA